MSGQHYAFQELFKLKTSSDSLKLYILVDGIQYERFFGEELKEGEGIHSLFYFPEDKIFDFAGPWLLDSSNLLDEDLARIILLEKKISCGIMDYQ